MRRTRCLLLCLAAILTAACSSGPRAGTALGEPGRQPSSLTYMDWMLAQLDGVEHDMPTITQAADAAADSFIAGRAIGFRGGADLGAEMAVRAGGFRACVATGPGRRGDLILYTFGVATVLDHDIGALLEKEIADAQACVTGGSIVIGIGSFDQLRDAGLLGHARDACTVLIDNHAPGADGLFVDAAGRPVIPTFTVADGVVAWAWSAELFAACTRRGHTPAINPGSPGASPSSGGASGGAAPGAPAPPNTPSPGPETRPRRSRRTRFVGDPAQPGAPTTPIPAGELGVAFVRNLRAIDDQIAKGSWSDMIVAGGRMATTLRTGGSVYVFAFPHYLQHHHGGQLAADPALFLRLNDQLEMIAHPGHDDFVLAVGYAQTPSEKGFRNYIWGNPPGVIRQAGRGAAYVVNTYRFKNDRADFLSNEMVVNQPWPPGDAIVPVKGYGTVICPASGLVAEAMMWMITAQACQDFWSQPHAATP